MRLWFELVQVLLDLHPTPTIGQRACSLPSISVTVCKQISLSFSLASNQSAASKKKERKRSHKKDKEYGCLESSLAATSPLFVFFWGLQSTPVAAQVPRNLIIIAFQRS